VLQRFHSKPLWQIHLISVSLDINRSPSVIMTLLSPLSHRPPWSVHLVHVLVVLYWNALINQKYALWILNFSIIPWPSVLWGCWLGGRKGIRLVKRLSDGVLVWLSVWSKLQMICIRSSWCHCHPIISCFIKIQNGSAFLVPTYPGCPATKLVLWVLQGSVDTLVRWGGHLSCRAMSNYVRNFDVKNY